MNTVLLAIILGSLLVSSMFYSLINAFKNLLNNIKITKSPAPAPAPSNSVVTITGDGIQFPKPSTTEGYITEALSCKKRKHVDRSEFDNSIINGFSDYESFEADRLNDIDEKWGENGWCKLAGIDEENAEGFIIGYQYHEGDFQQRVFDYDTKKCVFSGDDTPYACLYTEVKDAEGNVIGVENNKGEKLEVKFYNDYKSGKLQPFMHNAGMGTRMKYYLNDDGKLVFWRSGYNSGQENVSSREMVIKPGYNYPVLFMLLGTTVTMVDNDIDMPATGIPIKFQTLTEDEIRTNMQNDLENAGQHGGPGPGPGPA